MNAEKSIGRCCLASAMPFFLLAAIQFCLSGCCRCNQESESYDYIDWQVDRPKRDAAMPSTSFGTGLTPEAGVSGTFSIVAVDPNTDTCGAASAPEHDLHYLKG
jgi:hypothetical protein